eukprot:s3134_g5.t1
MTWPVSSRVGFSLAASTAESDFRMERDLQWPSTVVSRTILDRTPELTQVTVQFLTILIDPWAPPVRPTNTDGVNPDSSRHVLIEDSYLQTGDDAIAVKSGWDCFGRDLAAASENITIRRVTVRQTRGCNAAAFTIGSEMSGGVQDVTIEDCQVLNAGVAVEIKVGSSRGGFVRRIQVRKLEVLATARGALVSGP